MNQLTPMQLKQYQQSIIQNTVISVRDWLIAVGVILLVMIIIFTILLICKSEDQKKVNYIMSIIPVDMNDNEAVQVRFCLYISLRQLWNLSVVSYNQIGQIFNVQNYKTRTIQLMYLLTTEHSRNAKYLLGKLQAMIPQIKEEDSKDNSSEDNVNRDNNVVEKFEKIPQVDTNNCGYLNQSYDYNNNHLTPYQLFMNLCY